MSDMHTFAPVPVPTMTYRGNAENAPPVDAFVAATLRVPSAMAAAAGFVAAGAITPERVVGFLRDPAQRDARVEALDVAIQFAKSDGSLGVSYDMPTRRAFAHDLTLG